MDELLDGLAAHVEVFSPKPKYMICISCVCNNGNSRKRGHDFVKGIWSGGNWQRSPPLGRGRNEYDINTTYSCKKLSKNNKFSCGLAIMLSALVAQVTWIWSPDVLVERTDFWKWAFDIHMNSIAHTCTWAHTHTHRQNIETLTKIINASVEIYSKLAKSTFNLILQKI